MEDNNFNQTTNNQNLVKTEVEKRAISVSRLERLRLLSNMDITQFIEAFLSYESNNPSIDFAESITNFGESMVKLLVGKSPKTLKNKNVDADTVQYLIDNNLYPIKGILSKSIQSSRKYQEDHIYSVLIEQGPGTVARTICNMVDLNNVIVEINGITIGNLDLRDYDGIPLRDSQPKDSISEPEVKLKSENFSNEFSEEIETEEKDEDMIFYEDSENFETTEFSEEVL